MNRSQREAYEAAQKAHADIPVAVLRDLAKGMPYLHQSTKAEIIDWLRTYRPTSLPVPSPTPLADDALGAIMAVALSDTP
jgi:cytochrome c peroxidase